MQTKRPVFNRLYGERADPVIKCGKSLTKQSDTKSADINWIVKRFTETGQLPPAHGDPVYLDTTEIPDFQTMANARTALQTAFHELPLEEQLRHGNMEDWVQSQLDTIVQSEASQEASQGDSPPPEAEKSEPPEPAASDSAQLPS